MNMVCSDSKLMPCLKLMCEISLLHIDDNYVLQVTSQFVYGLWTVLLSIWHISVDCSRFEGDFQGHALFLASTTGLGKSFES